MQLIIAEKPSQGRTIAEALGIRGGGQGFIDGKSIVISWCIGHLVELAPPETYDPALEKWTLESLPFLPKEFKTTPSKGTLAQFKVLKNLLLRTDVDDVVCATDSGREGELIFDLVYKAAGCKKPVKRLWTASLTPEAILEAYKNLRPASEFAGLRAAAHCRAQADWLVGLNATRAQTLKAQSSGGQGVWSVGRVQTPTLAMLVEREKAIMEFVVKPFWTIEASFLVKDGAYVGKWFTSDNGKNVNQLWSKEEAENIRAKANARQGFVESVTGVEEKRRPEQLFDLTTLQRECNKRFGFSADNTLQIAQTLYENGILSYPRTSSRYLTEAEEAKLPKILLSLPLPYKAMFEDQQHGKLGKRFMDADKVEDHHAIIPTGKFAAMAKDEEKIFDLVARRTLAAYFPDEISKKTTIITSINTEKFRTVGKVVVKPGWTVVSPDFVEKENNSSDDCKRSLPQIKQGERPIVEKVGIVEGKTQPPKPHTEADLLGAMETSGKMLDDESLREILKEKGLGTPATRAAIIEGLLSRGLAIRKGKSVLPTEKGQILINSLKSDALKSPQLTGEWEEKLEQVRRMKLSSEEFMRGIRDYTTNIVRAIKDHSIGSAVMNSTPVIGTCPQCGSDLVCKSWQGKHYVKCTASKNPDCKISFDSDKDGKPKGGHCKKCKQPLKITKSKAKVCIGCGNWAQ